MKVQLSLLGMFAVVAITAVGCKKTPGAHHLPPSQMLMHPGPGVGGPGPGVMIPPGGEPMGYGSYGGTSQVAFLGQDGMAVSWDVAQEGMFDSDPLITPGRQNFGQGAIYRLKLTNVPGRPGVELYPTMEIGPVTPRTDAYLAHNAIPAQFTEEDFQQVLSGNFVTKVIYLPDPEFQELALAGVETLVSTRLDPGVDPIVEADRRGAILAILRIGNKDLEVPGEEGFGEVVPASHTAGGGPGAYYGSGGPTPLGAPTAGFAPGVAPPNYVSGVNGPQYGMPMSGTPIGLPGPPHIPLGVPAGLQKHVVKNNTHMHIPGPTKKFQINVKQRPGFSYPKPVSKVKITEDVIAPRGKFRNPAWNKHSHNNQYGGAECEDCYE